MKKLLVLILALVMCLTALTSCDQIQGAVGGVVDQVKEFVDGIINPGEETPAVTETQADDAITLLKNDYKEYEKNGTPGDVKGLPTVMMQGDVTVSWTIESNAEYVTLVTVPGEAGNPDTVTIDVNTDIDHEQDVAYTITAKIVDANNVERTHTFNFFIPKFKPSTHEDYMAAKSGDTLTIEGIVVALNSVSAGNKRNHIFLSDVDGKGGYYCYNMTSDPITDGIQVGMTVRISGNMSPSNGMQELYQANFVKIIDSTIKTVDPIDITNLFVSGGNLDAYVGHSVTIKGVTLGGQSLAVETDQYLYFTLNDKESYIRTYYTDLPHTLVTPTGDKANKLAIEADHAAHYGWTADVTGILVYYSGSPYLIPTSVNCFTNYVEPQRTDAEKVELEAGRLSLPENVGEDTVITLPLTGVSYDEVKFAWTCPEADYVTYDATTGKLTIVLPAEATTLTLSYTITLNDATKTGTVEIAVDAAATDVYVPENVETPAADKAYKFYLAQNNRGEVLYFAGEMSGNFLATTTKADKATDVYLETVEGGFRLYFKNADGEKVYIDAHEYQTGKVGVRLTGEPTCVWTFDADLGVLTTVVIEKTWYLGTYNTFNTMSLSETWRISGEKAGDVGVSQFPAYLANLAPAAYAPENVETPAADKAYKFYLAQNNRGEVLYFAGEMSGNFLATTTKADKATDVYLETVEGGFRLYFKNADGEKVYIDAHEYQTGKVGVRLTGEPTCVWTFDADLGVLTTVVIEKTWYLGTYNTFNTMSLSETWRISGEKAGDVGVSQFPAYLANVVAKEVAPENVETPAADKAYKFYLAQNNRGEVLYFAGEMSGNFLATTTRISKATDVYLETVEGGFRLYFKNADGEKVYIDAHEYQTGKVGVRLTGEPTCVWTFDADLGVLTTVVIEKTWYLGTYNTFNTMSLSETWRISGEKAGDVGVSQFPAYLATIEFVKEEVETPEHTHTACTECGKCTAEDCTGEKCEGHEVAPTHTHTPCATCNLCTAADCTGEASEKCAGHVTIYTTAEEIINAAYALAEGETLSNGHNYTLTGLIQSVDTAYNSQFSNVTVTILVDGTNKTIQCFRLKGTGADVIKVGDTITVTGVIKNYYGKIEFDAGCTLDSYVPGAPVETTGVVLSFASTSARTEFNTSKQVWENGALKLTNDKASSTSNVADYYGPARFYKNSTITIEYADGIKTLTFTCDSQAKYQLTSGVGISVEGATIVQNGAVTTITFAEPVTSVTITLSVQQVRINTLEVNK